MTYILRKVKKPIPLYARRLQVFAPIKDKELGYDLQIGDWVMPHGIGKVTDVLFNFHYSKTDLWTFNYRLAVTFPNKHDGIQQFKKNESSVLQSTYFAPQNGYISKWIQTSTRSGKKSKIVSNVDPHRGHWMRVRTEVDGKENVVSANYVKIYGDFPDIRYYFNPTPNDRNLEFDTSKTLFKGLKSEEKVKDP